jgi:large subunit ribosomal protein L4
MSPATDGDAPETVPADAPETVPADAPEDAETVPADAPEDAETVPAGAPETVLAGAPEDAEGNAVADEVDQPEPEGADEAEVLEASSPDEAPADAAPADAVLGAEPGQNAEADAEPEEAAAEAEAEVAPAKPARRRSTAKAADADDEAQAAPAKAPSRSRAPKVAPKPKREAAKAAFTPVDAVLPDEIFDAKVNIPLIHQVVVAQQAAARQGTHATKTRGDVRGGGRKPYRQKGTGRARQGSTRAPQFAGGGVVHGPLPRSYEQKTPKKMKAAALRGALSDRARHGLVQVVDGFVDGTAPKTRDALAVLHLTAADLRASQSRSVLVVAEATDQVTWKSLRNEPGVHLIDPGQLNTYDVLVTDRIVFTSAALASFVSRTGAVSEREDA